MMFRTFPCLFRVNKILSFKKFLKEKEKERENIINCTRKPIPKARWHLDFSSVHHGFHLQVITSDLPTIFIFIFIFIFHSLYHNTGLLGFSPSPDMDALLLHCPSMACSPKHKLKRPCSSTFTDPVPRVSNSRIDHVDSLLESLLGIPDSSLSLLDISLDRLLDSRPSEFEKTDVIDRAHKLGSVLLEASKRSARKRASMHNAVVWAIPADLTIKVLSLILLPIIFSSRGIFFFSF